MLVIPAIDLMNGKVVRLTRGEASTAKVYDDWGSPVQVATIWKSQGAQRLHIIDLDAAFGKGNNVTAIDDIVKASEVPIQVGGGIRTLEIAEKLLKNGVNHVILGALAFSYPQAIPQLQRTFGSDAVIVALDNKQGKVMIEGWQTETAFTLAAAMDKFTRLGVKTFLVTSIVQDGLLQGPDLETLTEARKHSGAEVIAAGGIGSVEDLLSLKKIGVAGVVVGKALYERHFTLKQAINAVEG